MYLELCVEGASSFRFATLRLPSVAPNTSELELMGSTLKNRHIDRTEERKRRMKSRCMLKI